MADARAAADHMDILADDDWEDVDDEDVDALEDSPEDDDLDYGDVAPESSLASPDSPLILPAEDDDSDPYHCEPPATSSLPMPSDVHPNGAVYLVYLMVVWLHTRFKVPFRACNVILVISAVIFSLSSVDLSPSMFSTLDSVLTTLAVEPQFCILPVCPQCKMPHPASTTPDSLCSKCSSQLFNTAPTVGQQRRGQAARTKAIPLLRFPYKPLEHQLIDLIPEIEDQLDSWRLKDRVDGEYADQFDGQICKELPGHDGLPFFRPDLKQMPDGEIRLGITLGVDW